MCNDWSKVAVRKESKGNYDSRFSSSKKQLVWVSYGEENVEYFISMMFFFCFLYVKTRSKVERCWSGKCLGTMSKFEETSGKCVLCLRRFEITLSISSGVVNWGRIFNYALLLVRIGKSNQRFVKDCFVLRWIIKIFYRDDQDQ